MKYGYGELHRFFIIIAARKGYSVVEQRSFFVRTTGGPLADGERARAVAWGRELARSQVRGPADLAR